MATGGKYNINGTGKQGGGGPDPFKRTPTVGGSIGGSPGLYTSTGGLIGDTGALYAPFIDEFVNRTYFILIDPTNFDTEEDGYYYFPSPDSPNGVGRAVTVNKLLMRYREIGKAKFTVGVIAFNDQLNNFTFIEKVVTIGPTKTKGKFPTTFPDGRLHTMDIDFRLTGENPQIYIKRSADSGPFSISKIVMIGTADEDEQL